MTMEAGGRIEVADFRGMIVAWPTATPPTGWLVCDGSAISRTTYADLFALIGTTYGVGNGTTTFNIPNMKGKVIVGFNSAETEFDTLGETGGEKTHTLDISEMPAHTHSVNSPSTPDTNAGYDAGVDASAAPTTTSSTGGGAAHNNLQPYITVNFIIKY